MGICHLAAHQRLTRAIGVTDSVALTKDMSPEKQQKEGHEEEGQVSQQEARMVGGEIVSSVHSKIWLRLRDGFVKHTLRGLVSVLLIEEMEEVL
jgi:hypothetical protein